MQIYPFSVPALRVEQPLGVFFVAILPARLLLDVAYSDVLSASLKKETDNYQLDGTQRIVSQTRLRQIADYIDRTDAAFPNSIILSANFRKEDGLVEDAPGEALSDADAPGQGGESLIDRRWFITESANGCCTLTIPSNAKLAAIIDGQHRLFGFVTAKPENLAMSLMCSIYLDLPKPFQAQLFATINSTQKRVDKSLTYELFGYNVEEEKEDLWSPDKLAVFFSRRLATDEKSPLKGRIVIAPKRDDALQKLSQGARWKVSTAVVVDGILRLFTTNPKKDTALLFSEKRKKRGDLNNLRVDRSPLRAAYLDCQDAVIYAMVLNFLIACEAVFWRNALEDSFISKTVGVQALFDILRELSTTALLDKDISVEYFKTKISPASAINFSDPIFRNASGSGRSAIRRAIEDALD